MKALTKKEVFWIEANTLLSDIGFERGRLASAHAIHNGLTVLLATQSLYHGENLALEVLSKLPLNYEFNLMDVIYESTFKAKPVNLKKQSIAGFTALTGRTVNITDCYAISTQEEFIFYDAYDKLTNYKTISMLSVPMILQDGTIVGVIQLINKFDENNNIIPFPKELEEVISAIASQAAVAIHNSWLKRIQSESSFIFVVIVLTLCFYIFFLAFLDIANFDSFTITTLVFCFYFIIIAIVLIRRSGLSISKFGLNTKNLKQSLIESF